MFDEKVFVLIIVSYYSDVKMGYFVLMLFNSLMLVLYYNKDVFKKVGFDLNQLLKMWVDVKVDVEKLCKVGMVCGFMIGWQGWIQFENYSVWYGLLFVSCNNGFDGIDVVFEFNKLQQIVYFLFFQQMVKDGMFMYVGCKDEVLVKFYSGDCGILMMLFGVFVNVQKFVKFSYGMGMMLYDVNVKGVLQNVIIGGVSLWVLVGKDFVIYKGVVKFFVYLVLFVVVVKWYQDIGYLLVMIVVYDLMCQQGFYVKNLSVEIVIKQMLNKLLLLYMKGLCLGNMLQICMVVDEEFEQVWVQKKVLKDVFDLVVLCGDELLCCFEKLGG